MANGLIKRSLAGLLMGVIMIGGMLSPYLFSVVVCFAIVVMVHEYYQMSLGAKKYCLEKIFAVITIISAFLLHMAVAQFGISTKYFALLLIPFLAILITLLFDPQEQKEDGHKMEHIIFPLLYIGVPMVFLPKVMYTAEGVYTWRIFISTFVLIWLSDIGAYFVGMALGQRPNSKKLYPSVSPKKSWIGVFGGVIFTFAGAVIIHFTNLVNLPLIHLSAIAFLVVLFGILGDLFESLIKRHYGFKDSGTIMPGHGGLLDRFDGALFVFPIIALYLHIFSIV